MEGGKIGVIPTQASHRWYGGGKIGVIPTQVGYCGYGRRKNRCNYPCKQVIVGMRAGKVSVIPSPEQSSGYGGGKIGMIPTQASHRGYESKKSKCDTQARAE